MSVTVHQRPGVYSSYDASSVALGRGRGAVVGLVGVNTKAKSGQVQMVTSYDRAVTLFGTDGDENMAELINLALCNGASAVAAVPVASSSSYQTGLDKLAAMEDVAVVICGSTEDSVQQKLKTSVVTASENRRERIAVMAGAANESVSQLTARAKKLNCERVVLVAPSALNQGGGFVSGLSVAAALAGAIAGEADPAVPMSGVELRGVHGLSQLYNDGELDQLILSGVTPVEEVGGSINVVRAVTTRTNSGGVEDRTWRELTTICIADDVIPSLRQALRAKFRRAKNTERSRSAIRAQVVLELEDKLAREIITGYDSVEVRADSQEPTRCLVEFSFTVAHGLNQIWLTAHIQV